MNHIPTKPKAIIYLRVSSKEQLKGKSMETQKADCEKYCAEQGFEVVEIFTEEGESAKNDDRTQLQRLLAYCRENKKQISYLIIWKVDRLARNIGDFYEIQKTLMAHGVIIHSATETGINGEGITAEVMTGFLAIFARIDNKIKSDRSKTNMRSLLRSGIYPLSPPLGYTSRQNKKHGQKKRTPDPIDEERFFIIQRGLKEFSTGVHTVKSLTMRFRELGLTSRTGKTIYPQMVDVMLTNVFYAGWIEDKHWTPEDLPEENLVRGLHTPAITLEEFQKNQLIKAGRSVNAKPRSRANPDFPLRDFARCYECKGTLTGSWSSGHGGRYAYYHCKNRKCARYGKGNSKMDVEKSFTALLEKVAPTDVALTLFREIALDVWETNRKLLNADGERHEKRIAEIKVQIAELITMRGRGLITDEQLLEGKQPLEEAKIIAQLALNETRIEEWDIEAAISYATQFMRDLPRQWLDYSLENKQRFQQMVFPEGIIYEKEKVCRTQKLGLIYELLQGVDTPDSTMVPLGGAEPRKPSFEIRASRFDML
ncbi:MAG: recombinase family protein [Patescibacteria group bacterium]|nr:recombinase family protein [Patescibacteria group bacterium]